MKNQLKFWGLFAVYVIFVLAVAFSPVLFLYTLPYPYIFLLPVYVWVWYLRILPPVLEFGMEDNRNRVRQGGIRRFREVWALLLGGFYTMISPARTTPAVVWVGAGIMILGVILLFNYWSPKRIAKNIVEGLKFLSEPFTYDYTPPRPPEQLQLPLEF